MLSEASSRPDLESAAPGPLDAELSTDASANASHVSPDLGLAEGSVMASALGTSRHFPGGSRAAFLEALLQRCGQAPEQHEIQGGVQFIFIGRGNINFFDR